MAEHEQAQSLRVCLLIGSFHPVVGGGERHARDVSRELTRTGVPVRVLTRRSTPGLARIDSIDGVPVRRLPPSGSPRWGKYLMLLPALVALVRSRRDYDVIYVCGLRVLGIAGMLASRLVRKPCVLRSEACGELSGAFIWDSPHRPRVALLRAPIRWMLALRNRLFSGAARFLAVSGVVRDEYLGCGVEAERIAVIPNGIDTQRFTPAPPEDRRALREELGLPQDGRVFSYAGKLDLGKGLEGLLRVWQQLAGEFCTAHLVLVGGGERHFLSCEPALKAFVVEHGLASRVTFTGYVDNVPDYLRVSDFFVFPSESESFGIALLEALACELPAVSTATGGAEEIITDGENGLLVPVGDEDALFSAMARLLREPDRAVEMGRRGRETVLSRFSMVRVAEEHRKMFSAVAQRRV